jgi:nickel-dependent lactate racemase
LKGSGIRMGKAFVIKRGRKVFFDLPAEWNLLTFAGLKDGVQAADAYDLAVEVLNRPVGSPLLRERLSPSDTVAILIEDLTRASPKGIILREILDELAEVRIPDHHITIVIALGTHRGLTPEELAAAFGADLVARYGFVNHDCHAPDLVPVGRLPTGRVVKINRAVHEARFKIGIGSIFPHPMNGFGGGGKILFPGVADFDSIREHHFQYTFHDGAGLGKMVGNPFYEQVSGIAQAAGLNFIVNTILDQRDEAHDLVCGDPVHAHLEGIEKSRGIISQDFQGKADLTLITSFPYSEGPQIVKPLAPAAMVTREQGCIILCADLAGDLPDSFVESFDRFHREHGHDLLGGVLDHFRKNRLIMEGGAIDFNMALAMTLAVQHRFRTILVSKDISRDQGEKMGFTYARDLEEAFDLGSAICPRPNVHIIPSGGVILPVVRPR